jgi:DNA-binding transcriptional MerR regulator
VVGFTPQQVFDYLSDILKFSSEISISQIPQFMKKRIEEKEKLESVVQKLSKKINELSDIAEEKEREIERFSKMEDVMTKTYQSFAISRD